MKRAPRWRLLDGPVVGYTVDSVGALAERGPQLVSVHADPVEALTAPLSERPGLVEALVAVELHGAAALLIADPAHLGSKLAWASVEALVERHAAQLLALAGGELQDEDGFEVKLGGVKAMMLDVHRLARAVEIRAGHVRRARAGKRNSRFPAYGFEVASDGETLLEVPEERRAVDRMLALRAQGLSYAKVASVLDAEGFSTRRGGRWASTTVRQVVQREQPDE